MSYWQGRSVRKTTGGRYKSFRDKKKFENGKEQTETNIGERNAKKIRSRGGKSKVRLMTAQFANIIDPKNKTAKKVAIESVIQNSANHHFIRRNIITKGAIIKTEAGDARVTSRPGQDGNINAVLI